jgi:LVIVD repeat
VYERFHPTTLYRFGHADLQGRTAYQPTLHTIKGRVYLFVGHFAGTTPAGLPNGGTTIVDVTDPDNPKQVNFLVSNGSQMVRVCDGGAIGQANHYYMLRNTRNTHEVWDVTNPASPTRLSVIQPAPTAFFTATHKNWWECDTGLAFLVAGAGASSAAPDGWTTNQHVKIYDLSNPAAPVYIRDIGLVGQNPGSSVVTATSGVDGPISIKNNPVTGDPVNRIYLPFGTSSNGVMQIMDRLKVLPPAYGGTWNGLRPQNPTDDDLQSLVVGSMTMTPTEGAHTTFPVFGVPLKHYQGFASSTTRDLVALISEETDDHCQGAPHFGYLVDATRTVGAGAASAGENHPMVISTMQVFEDSARPDFCTRGTRFGTHSTNESFYAPYYGKLLFIAYFDGGLRVFDIRDPYHPKNCGLLHSESHPQHATNARDHQWRAAEFFGRFHR